VNFLEPDISNNLFW